MILNWLVWICAVLAVAFAVLPALTRYMERKAFNAGFAYGKIGYADLFVVQQAAHKMYLLASNRRAFILGARHAKGY